jgi:hypothetical protein
MMNQTGFNILKDESGVLTLDFIFAFSISMALTLILLALSFSLATFEITQYVTFAVARNYAGGHDTKSQQDALAHKKFDQLTKEDKVISSLYKNGWFKLDKLFIGDMNTEYNDLGYGKFIGARVELNAKVLEFKAPMLGATFSEEDGFKSNFASFLLRAPSREECVEKFTKKRYEEILKLDSAYQAARGKQAAVITDNGC